MLCSGINDNYDSSGSTAFDPYTNMYDNDNYVALML